MWRRRNLFLAALAALALGGSGVLFAADSAVTLSLLYAQDANCTGGLTVSQDYETLYAGSSTQVADDFTVPAGDTWDVGKVFVRGGYTAYIQAGPASALNVAFFDDDAGKPAVAPIAACNYTGLIGFTDVAGEFSIPLQPSACHLPGDALGTRYWASVQVRMDYIPYGTWGWRDRGPQIGLPAYWRNPGDSYHLCAAWDARAYCLQPADQSRPDQCFALRGASTVTVYRDGFDGN